MFKISCFGLSATIFFLGAITDAESVTNKCTDGKKITYANVPCEEMGLKFAGPVKNSVTVIPAIQKPKEEPPEKPAKKPIEKHDSTGEGSPGPEGDETETPPTRKIKPVNPLIEKLL